jgi:thiamine biosynthesis lipoprotein
VRSALVLLVVLLWAGAARAATSHGSAQVLAGRAMGTTWRVTLLQPAPPLDLEAARARLGAELERWEMMMSTWRANSELSRFNAARDTNWFAVSREHAAAVIEARRISELTGGAFDVTVEPLVRLWGFGAAPRRSSLPAPAAIARARARVDWRMLEARLDPPALRKMCGELSADLSGIAKGGAVDALSEQLALLGATNHLVEIGGELRARGAGEAGRPWRAGIEHPLRAARGILCALELRDRAVATSGDYRNFLEREGRRFPHILDPRTGRPVTNGTASVSVVGETAMQADALATGLMVLGAEEGLRLAAREGLACQFVLRAGASLEVRRSPAFERLLAR